MREYLEEGRRLDRPHHASRPVYQIMKDCWVKEPSKRPNFRQLAEDLEKILDAVDRDIYLDMNNDINEDSKSHYHKMT